MYNSLELSMYLLLEKKNWPINQIKKPKKGCLEKLQHGLFANAVCSMKQQLNEATRWWHIEQQVV